MTTWHQATQRDPAPQHNGIDFELTNAERSKCASYTVALEEIRRNANLRADKRLEAAALAEMDGV